MKVLITGGAGFIGSNLVKFLLQDPAFAEIRVIDDLSTGRRATLDGLDVQFSEGSVLDSKALDLAATGVDAIVHLAAIPSVPRSIGAPEASHDANATGTLRVLESARRHGVHHVIVASSSSVYGSNPKLPKRELDWTRPLSPYGASKLAAEAYTLAYQASYGLNTLAFRFFNVYGPGQAAGHAYAAVVPKFVSAALAGAPVEIHGDGGQTRDFTYVGTVCAVLREALVARVVDPHPVNLAYGTNTSLLDLLHLMEESIGKTIARTHVPPRVGDVRASQSDGARMRELFPQVAPVPLDAGLAQTVEWYKGHLARA